MRDWTALFDALGEHSPTIEPDLPTGCWLDLRAGKRAPSLGTRCEALLTTVNDWGHATARLGVAPTPGVARLAARHGTRDVTVLADAHAVSTFLTPLTPDKAGLDPTCADRLALIGLRNLGTIAALPRGSLGDHLGPAGPALEALARGEDDRPLVPIRPPLVLSAHRSFDWAIDDRASLAHLISTILAPLLAHLEHRGLGATRVTLTLGQEGKRPTARSVNLPVPMTALDRIRAALLDTVPIAKTTTSEHSVDAAQPQAGFTALSIAISAPRPLVGRQASFFDLPTGRAALLQSGVREVQSRSTAPLGYLHLTDPEHPYADQRYTLEEIAEHGEGESTELSATGMGERS